MRMSARSRSILFAALRLVILAVAFVMAAVGVSLIGVAAFGGDGGFGLAALGAGSLLASFVAYMRVYPLGRAANGMPWSR